MSLTKENQGQPNTFAEVERELEMFSLTFPILERLDEYLQEHGNFRGQNVGWHCHLTVITAASAQVLLNAGARLFMSECNPATSNQVSIDYMRKQGAIIHCGSGSAAEVLKERPVVLSDTGFVLIDEYLNQIDRNSSDAFVSGACEITSSGVQKLRKREHCPLPVININDGELKTYIENFHGVGDGVIDSLFKVTGKMLSGRSVAVAGYGRVGAGVAAHLRSAGAIVSVVENDPARRLIAHYDGFALSELPKALSSSEILVTATGRHSLITPQELIHARDGLILMNVGHWPEEIAYAEFGSSAKSQRRISEFLEEFEFSFDGESRRVLLLGGGGPANVVMCSGSIEPTLIHLVTEILCLNHMLALKNGSRSAAPGNAGFQPASNSGSAAPGNAGFQPASNSGSPDFPEASKTGSAGFQPASNGSSLSSSSNSAPLRNGENPLPKSVQDLASLLALKALGLA